MEALKALLESDAISEQMKSEIQGAWDVKVVENRNQVTTELREEFAKKYEHDKSAMIEAIDTVVSEKLTEEMVEFNEDRKQLAEAKAKYAIKMREDAALMKNCVMEQLAGEISELHSDQKTTATKFAVLEDFVVEQLAKELAEFQEDKKDLAETKVRLVRESKSHFAKVKQDFITRSVTALSETVEKGLRSEILQLKEDIEVARMNDFGRKIFEAFAGEYLNSHLNEKSETKKLLKVLNAKDKQLAEAKTFVIKAKNLAESKNNEVKHLVESRDRAKVLNDLTSPLSKGQKSIMNDLLETVQTNRLQSSFNKYLPSVIDGGTQPKQKAMLKEGKEVTGNRKTENMTATADTNVLDMRRLAGLK